jgi:hypothetical protein
VSDDQLDIRWWESPITGGFDWELLTLPVGFIVIVVGIVVAVALGAFA